MRRHPHPPIMHSLSSDTQTFRYKSIHFLVVQNVKMPFFTNHRALFLYGSSIFRHIHIILYFLSYCLTTVYVQLQIHLVPTYFRTFLLPYRNQIPDFFCSGRFLKLFSVIILRPRQIIIPSYVSLYESSFLSSPIFHCTQPKYVL